MSDTTTDARRPVGGSATESPAQLAASASALLAIADALPALIAYVDAGLRYQFNNRAYEEWFGTRREEIRGMLLIDVVGEEAFEVVKPYVYRVLAGEHVTFESDVPYRGAGLRRVRATYTPDFAPDGTVRGYFSLINDLASDTIHEEAVRQSEERYRSLAEATASTIWATAPDGGVVKPLPSWQEYTGQTWDEYRGYGWTARFHPDDIAEVRTRWSESLASGEVFRTSARVWHAASGEYHHCDLRAVPVLSNDGTISEWIGTTTDVHDARCALEALRTSEERARLAEASARFGTWEWDLGEHVSWSPSMERMYGFEPGTYPGTFEAFRERVHPDDRQRTADAIERVLADPSTELDFEHRIMLPDGGEHWMNGRGRVIYDAFGKPLKMIGIGLDITERKHAQQELSRALTDAQDAVELVGTIIDSTPTAFVMFDRDSRYIRVNRAAAEINGLTIEEHLGHRLEEVLPEVGPAAAARYREVLSSGEHMPTEEISGETPAVPGRPRWWLHSASPVRNAAGEIVAVAVIFTEITDRKMAEAALRESEQREHLRAEVNARLVSALDSAQILSHVADLAVPALADVCAVGLFDQSPATARTRVAGAGPDVQSAISRTHLRRWRARPGSDETIDDSMMRGDHVSVPDFSPEWIAACAPDEEQRAAALGTGARSIACVPLVARGTSIGMVTFARIGGRRPMTPQDVLLALHIAAQTSIAVDNAQLLTNLVETATSLRRANQAKDEFLSLVSHELRTPITMILGNAEVLERRLDMLAEQERKLALSDIKLESERLYRIIDNLLALARVDTGQVVEPEPIVLRRIVERMVEQQRRTSTERVYLCHWQGDDDLVAASPDYIEQVLRNLISNAVKYSRVPAPIEIIGVSTDMEVEVRVLDRGSGITDEDSSRIFTPFYRSPRTAATAQGVGIGLAVCKRLIEAQGGRLWARPRDEGGSEFGFALPRLAIAEA